MKLKHITAFCAALALASLSAGMAQANEKKIDVTVKFDKTTEVKQMTPVELAAMLKKLRLDDDWIKKAVAAAEKDGQATLQLKMAAPPEKK